MMPEGSLHVVENFKTRVVNSQKKQDILYELSPHELVPQCQQTPGGVIIPSEL